MPSVDNGLAAFRQESYAALTTATTSRYRPCRHLKRVGELSTIDPQFAPYAESRDAIKSQLEDLPFSPQVCDGSPGRLRRGSACPARAWLKRKYGPLLLDVLEKGAPRWRASAADRRGRAREDLITALDAAVGEAGSFAQAEQCYDLSFCMPERASRGEFQVSEFYC